MEEDIKMLEWSQQQMRLGNLPDYNQKVYKAIENLINRNKELEEIEESHRKENGELRERIKQLEDTNKKLYEIGKEIGKQHKYTSENYIPKSKVEEKIEELKKYRNLAKEQIEENIIIADSNSLNYGRSEAHDKDIQVLQELLEE